MADPNTTRSPPMRWRKKDATGRYRMPAAYELARANVVLATVQSTRDGTGWYWYARGMNTASTPKPLDDCKADALAHIKATEVSNAA